MAGPMTEEELEQARKMADYLNPDGTSTVHRLLATLAVEREAAAQASRDAQQLTAALKEANEAAERFRIRAEQARQQAMDRAGELSAACRERDEATVRLGVARVARERAEADNAALREAFTDAFRAMTHMGDTLNSLDAVDEEEDAEAMGQCERATAFAQRLIEGKSHPGAALLERMRAAERMRFLASHDEACRHEGDQEPKWAGLDPERCAVCAFDALKVPRE